MFAIAHETVGKKAAGHARFGVKPGVVVAYVGEPLVALVRTESVVGFAVAVFVVAAVAEVDTAVGSAGMRDVEVVVAAVAEVGACKQPAVLLAHHPFFLF